MTVGAGGKFLANVPAQSYDLNPELFNRLTQPEKAQKIRRDYPGPGVPLDSIDLPHTGILGEIRILFEGTVSGAAAGVDDPNWAYRLLSEIRYSGTGATDMQTALAEDYHTLRFINYPAMRRDVEFFSTSPDENGNFRVLWVVPVATDMTSYVGASFAQSQSTNLWLDLRTAGLAELGLTGATITGKFTISQDWTSIPLHPDGSGRIVIPDLTKTHGIVRSTQRFNQTGEVPVSIPRLNATVMRIIGFVDLGHAQGVPNRIDWAAANQVVESIVFEYGGTQRPRSWEPAWELAAKNVEDYGSLLPKGYFCLDLVRRNAVRDTIVLPGVTDPKLVFKIKSGTALTDGARIHLATELLYHS